jgi:hypothetical protein
MVLRTSNAEEILQFVRENSDQPEHFWMKPQREGTTAVGGGQKPTRAASDGGTTFGGFRSDSARIRRVGHPPLSLSLSLTTPLNCLHQNRLRKLQRQKTSYKQAAATAAAVAAAVAQVQVRVLAHWMKGGWIGRLMMHPFGGQ